MKSIKPGRAPSMMGGFMGIAVAMFGVIWTIAAASAGGGLFALFGVVFVIIAIATSVYNFKNATSKNRYSAYDITEEGEEPDPLNQRFGSDQNEPYEYDSTSSQLNLFCPYCGTPVDGDYAYCNRCGKRLP